MTRSAAVMAAFFITVYRFRYVLVMRISNIQLVVVEMMLCFQIAMVHPMPILWNIVRKLVPASFVMYWSGKIVSWFRVKPCDSWMRTGCHPMQWRRLGEEGEYSSKRPVTYLEM